MDTDLHHKSLCWGCGKRSDSLKQCAACHTASYCGKECQTKNWFVHSGDCVAYQATHPANTAENIADWLEDVIDNASDRGHITDDQLERGEELVDILDPIPHDNDEISSRLATVEEKKEAINLAIHLNHCIHDLTQEDVMNAKNMKFHENLHPEDLLDALERKIEHGVDVMEEIMDVEDSESYDELNEIESEYIGEQEEGEFVESDSESEDYIEGEICKDDKIGYEFEDEDRPTLLALGHFETTLDKAHSIADDLWEAIGDLEKTGASIDQDVIQKALDMLVHCSMAIETTEGLELVGKFRRRRKRRRKRARKGQRKGQRKQRRGQKKTQRGQRSKTKRTQRSQRSATRKSQRSQRKKTRRSQRKQKSSEKGADRAHKRKAKQQKQQRKRAEREKRRRKKKQRRTEDRKRRKAEKTRKKGGRQRRKESKKRDKTGKKEGKGKKRQDKKRRRREDRKDRKRKRTDKRKERREKRKGRKDQRRKERKDDRSDEWRGGEPSERRGEEPKRSDRRREKGKEHERETRSSRRGEMRVPVPSYGAGGYLAERGRERRMRREREEERIMQRKEDKRRRQEYLMETRTREEDRRMRQEEEDRVSKQRREEEDRERRQRREDEDRERQQRQEDEKLKTLEQNNSNPHLEDKEKEETIQSVYEYDDADFNRKLYMDLLRQERVSCKVEIVDFLEKGISVY